MRIMAWIFAAALAACAGLVQAQGFPGKPIRLVVPYPPGGSPDVLARILAQKAAEGLGQSIFADNRPGAGGMVAVNAVTQSPADGYTLLMADSSVYSIGPNLSRAAAFDPLGTLVPVTLAATSPIYLIANPALNVNNVTELLAVARARPGLPYGSSGNGTAHHLAMELLKSLAKVDLTHVPYKGAAQTVPAVVSGDVAVAFAGLNLALPQVKAGKVNLLGIATGKRSSLTPELPTLAESGVPGFDVTITLGLFAPLKTPKEIVEKLNAEFVKALSDAEVRQRLVVLGVEAVGAGPEAFRLAIRKELQDYGTLVKATGARVD